MEGGAAPEIFENVELFLLMHPNIVQNFPFWERTNSRIFPIFPLFFIFVDDGVKREKTMNLSQYQIRKVSPTIVLLHSSLNGKNDRNSIAIFTIRRRRLRRHWKSNFVYLRPANAKTVPPNSWRDSEKANAYFY